MPTADVARLHGWFEEGRLLRPSADVPNSVALARWLAAACGAPDVALDPASQPIGDAVGVADHYVFVLADGLGMNLVNAQPGGSFLRDHAVMTLQAVYPPSTAPALTSIATGLWPAQHAAVEWFVYFPARRLTAVLLPFVERYTKAPLAQLGLTADEVFPHPSLLNSFLRDVMSYLPQYIAGSTYSQYFSGGAPVAGYQHLDGACAAIAARIRSAGRPTYTYLYVPYVDAAEHEHGPASDAVRNVLQHFDHAMARLDASLPPAARIVITADHGLTFIEPDRQCLLDDGDELLDALLAPPAGEARLPMFHVREGLRDRFVDTFHRRFTDAWALLSSDEADELRLFGPRPLSGESRRRIGDFIAIPGGADAILYRPETPMLGHHGGLTADEMLVPLIVA